MNALLKISIYLVSISIISILLSSCGLNDSKDGVGLSQYNLTPSNENTPAPGPQQESNEESFNLEVEFASLLNNLNPFVSSVMASEAALPFCETTCNSDSCLYIYEVDEVTGNEVLLCEKDQIGINSNKFEIKNFTLFKNKVLEIRTDRVEEEGENVLFQVHYSGLVTINENLMENKNGRVVLSKEKYILSKLIKEDLIDKNIDKLSSEEKQRLIESYEMSLVAENFNEIIMAEQNYSYDKEEFLVTLEELRDTLLTTRENRANFRKIIKKEISYEESINLVTEALPEKLKTKAKSNKKKNSEWKDTVMEFVNNVQNGGVAKGGVKGNNK